MNDRPLEGQVALVTGASRGIGHHCALAYARAGARIVAIARTVGGLEELDDAVRAMGGEATLVPLDLRDGPGVDRLGPALAERFGRLDILFGNAAVLGPQTPVSHLADKDWAELLDVNLSANVRLLRGLDPLLRSAPTGRALFVTCEIADVAPAYLAAYAATKAGLEAFVRSYAREVAHTSVTANMLDPGPVATRLRMRHLPGEDASGLPTPGDFAGTIVRTTDEARERTGAVWRRSTGGWTPSG